MASMTDILQRKSRVIFLVLFVFLVFELYIGYTIYDFSRQDPYKCVAERITKEIAEEKEDSWSLMLSFGVVPRQFDRLLENMELWSDLLPCDISQRSNHRIGLYFTIHTLWEQHEAGRAKFIEAFNNASYLHNCFDEIGFLNADTKVEEKAQHWKRGLPSAPGPNAMFRTAVTGAQQLNYTYLMWMEADAFPIRKYWMDILMSTTTREPTFIIRGSPHIMETNQQAIPGLAGADLSYRAHINGNALYAITPLSLAFMQKSFKDRGVDPAWDIMFYEELHSGKNYQAYNKLLPTYQHNLFIQNRHNDVTPLDKILDGHPETIFIHHPWSGNPPRFRDYLKSLLPSVEPQITNTTTTQ